MNAQKDKIKKSGITVDGKKYRVKFTGIVLAQLVEVNRSSNNCIGQLHVLLCLNFSNNYFNVQIQHPCHFVLIKLQGLGCVSTGVKTFIVKNQLNSHQAKDLQKATKCII